MSNHFLSAELLIQMIPVSQAQLEALLRQIVDRDAERKSYAEPAVAWQGFSQTRRFFVTLRVVVQAATPFLRRFLLSCSVSHR